MSLVITYQQFWQRRGTTAEWTSANPVLHSGEIGVTTDAGNPAPYKIGDGATTWLSLPYYPTTANGGYSEGTSFPVSPAAGDKFFRTDLNYLCFYDGTRWLTVQEFCIKLNDQYAGTAGSLTFQVRSPLITGGIWITNIVASTYVTANSGSAYWDVRAEYLDSADVANTIGGFSTGTTPDAANTWIQHTHAINALLSTNARALQLAATNVGGAGTLFAPAELYYRRVIT